MKNIVISMTILLNAQVAFLQNNNLSFFSDTLKNQKLAILKQNTISYDNYLNISELIDKDYFKGKYDSNLSYTVVTFDYFFLNGIKLENLSQRHFPSLCSSIAAEGFPEIKEECEKRNIEIMGYIFFKKLYVNYKGKFLRELSKEKKEELERKIDLIVNNGIYAYPTLTKNLLLGKYDSIINLD